MAAECKAGEARGARGKKSRNRGSGGDSKESHWQDTRAERSWGMCAGERVRGIGG